MTNSLLDRLNDAMQRAMWGYDPHYRRRWISEYLLPALESSGLVVVEAGELEKLRADREAWRMRCPVSAEQVDAADITVETFERWRGSAEQPLLALAISTAIGNARRHNQAGWAPGPKWWAFMINRETETTEDAQRLLDALAQAGVQEAQP